MIEKEEDYYSDIMQKFNELFKLRGCDTHFEITANKKFSNKLQSKIPDYRHIIFYFLKDVAPDITGLVLRGNFADFVIIEVKNEEIKLDHVYQLRKYAELFEAKFAFLVSTEEIPEAMKRLAKVVYPLLSSPSAYQCRTLAYFDKQTKSVKDWYPENPFEKDYLWR